MADSEALPPSQDETPETGKPDPEVVLDHGSKSTRVWSGKTAGVIAMLYWDFWYLVHFIALPMAEIIIGSIYLNDCPAQRYLTIYMIVAGVTGLLLGCLAGPPEAANEEDEEDTKPISKIDCFRGCAYFLGLLFFVGWSMCGGYWLFGMVECPAYVTLDNLTSPIECFTVDPALEGNDKYCNLVVYKVAFWDYVFRAVIFGGLLIVWISKCCIKCLVDRIGSFESDQEALIEKRN